MQKIRLKPGGYFIIALIGTSVFAVQIDIAAVQKMTIEMFIRARDLSIDDLDLVKTDGMQISNLSTGFGIDYHKVRKLSHRADTVTELAAITDDGVVAMNLNTVAPPYKNVTEFLRANQTLVSPGSELEQNLNAFLTAATMNEEEEQASGTTHGTYSSLLTDPTTFIAVGTGGTDDENVSNGCCGRCQGNCGTNVRSLLEADPDPTAATTHQLG